MLRSGVFTAAALALALGLGACAAARAQEALDPGAMTCDTVTSKAIPTFIDPWLQKYQSQLFGTAGDEKFDKLGALLEFNDLIVTDNDVICIRRWEDDDKLVNVLIPLAAGPDVRLRVPATLILQNIVDNTNICRVLASLAAGGVDLDPDARYDLLLVVWQVANYAYSDVAQWMLAVLDLTDKALPGDFAKTQDLIQSIRDTLTGRRLGVEKLLSDKNQPKYQECLTALAPYIPIPS
ncbi:MAG: hypothetical protein HY834_02290 [Devosia nanyangense]|uniref:Uncharacterized protein n=1 Tax=Devosia nanyangense TaxID=1228055 RepID=A0A933KZQ1_9HYPH|nr:hypothetical protein [Devosia nanyangense]